MHESQNFRVTRIFSCMISRNSSETHFRIDPKGLETRSKYTVYSCTHSNVHTFLPYCFLNTSFTHTAVLKICVPLPGPQYRVRVRARATAHARIAPMGGRGIFRPSAHTEFLLWPGAGCREHLGWLHTGTLVATWRSRLRWDAACLAGRDNRVRGRYYGTSI